MEPSLKELEERISKIEESEKSRFRFFVQYLLSPIIVVVIGLVFNWQLEHSRKEIQQIQLAQSMLTTLFSEDEFKSLATQKLMNELLDNESLKAEIKKIVKAYLTSKYDKSVKNGDLESATEIYDAATSIKSPVGDDITRSIKTNKNRSKALDIFSTATGHEKEGFKGLIREDFESALSDFKKAYEVYPDLHSVSEIYDLLLRNSNNFNDPAVRRRIYKTIVDKYSWKVPKKIIIQLKKKLKSS